MATLTLLTIELDKWLEAPGQYGASTLSHLDNFEASLEDHAEKSKANLEKTLPEHKEIVQTNMNTFEAVYCLLPELRDHLAAENITEVKRLLGQLRGLREELLVQQSRMAEMGGQTRYCPGCGRKTQDICEKCELEAIDPAPPPAPTKEVTLGPLHFQTYQAYVDVLAGKRTLSDLLPVLDELEKMLKELRSGAQEALRERAGQSVLDMPRVVSSSLQAVETMRRGVVTRRAAELHSGWRTLFDDAQTLEAFLPKLEQAVDDYEKALNE